MHRLLAVRKTDVWANEFDRKFMHQQVQKLSLSLKVSILNWLDSNFLKNGSVVLASLKWFHVWWVLDLAAIKSYKYLLFLICGVVVNRLP